MATVQPAQRTLLYLMVDGVNYIDVASDLSKINRRAYSQGMQYAIGRVEFSFTGKPAQADTVFLAAYTAGDTWVVHNAWRKARSHWLQQQRRARRLIGQSAKPAYEDYKVYLDDAHRSAGTLATIAADNGAVGPGEWDYSVLHVEAEDHSISEWYMHIIGNDIGSTDKSLILGYQQSRATVQAESPDLPTEFSTNMYAQLADDLDDVAAHVADDMEDENDEPPYDLDDYPGNDTNSDVPWTQEIAVASAYAPNATLGGFVSECGLIKFILSGWTAQGDQVSAPSVSVLVTLVPGKYKGIMAKPMGQ